MRAFLIHLLSTYLVHSAVGQSPIQQKPAVKKKIHVRKVNKDSALKAVSTIYIPNSPKHFLKDTVNIWAYANGADIGNGMVDAAPALKAALAAARVIYIPEPQLAYAIGSTITIAEHKRIVGASKHKTLLKKVFDGDMFMLDEGAHLDQLFLDGNGASFTGRGLVMSPTKNPSAGKQLVTNCKINDFFGACIYFGRDAASQSVFENIETSRHKSASNDNPVRCAIEMDPLQQLEARTRKFVNIETQGTPSFNFGGCGDVFITNSFLADLVYTAESRGVLITNSRISNDSLLTINGHNNTIVGCDIYPRITIAKGADNISITGNSYNGGRRPEEMAVIDKSGNNRNSVVFNRTYMYTPALSSSAFPQPVLGKGSSIRGEWTRSGIMISLTVELTTNGTTSFGNGDLRFSIPPEIVPNKTSVQAQYGNGVVYSTTGNSIVSTVLITETNYLMALTQGSSYYVKTGVPYPSDQVNVIRLSITYSL